MSVGRLAVRKNKSGILIMKFYALLAASAIALSCAPLQAATVFSDDFNSEPGNTLNHSSFANFNVTGQVDLVAPVNGWGITVGSNVVDLDGTAGPGRLTSKASFAFNAGDVIRLDFDLGGAQRGSSSDNYYAGFEFGAMVDMIDYGFNFFGSDSIALAGLNSTTGVSTSTSVAGSDPITTRSIFFTAGNAGSLNFYVGTSSSDNVGPLLDGVRLNITPGAVPEPASWALMIGGFAIAGAAMRRRSAAAVSFA